MTRSEPAGASSIDLAAQLIRQGLLVAFATETVYGLAADATNANAVAAIFEAKGRPRFNPLIIHLADAETARSIVTFDQRAERLASRFWPGALSLVLPRTENCPVCQLAGAGLETLAVRVPEKKSARQLIRAAGVPLAAPSANKSGQVSPTSATHVSAAFGDEVALILDDGPCAIGLESTVLDLASDAPAILRPGGVTAEDIEAVIGPLATASDTSAAPASPGMMLRHYATQAPIRLNAAEAGENEALLSFGPQTNAPPAVSLSLSPSGDLREAAANLFEMMHALDRENPVAIAVSPIPETGLGVAINDRLRRAARR